MKSSIMEVSNRVLRHYGGVGPGGSSANSSNWRAIFGSCAVINPHERGLPAGTNETVELRSTGQPRAAVPT